MSNCTWIKQIELYADGEARDAGAVEGHLAQCGECARHHTSLLRMRSAIRGLPPVPALSEAQFPAFLDGINREIARPQRRPGGFWALLSLSAAALVIAIATFSLFTGPGPVKANEVESVSTQLDGATVRWGNSDDGLTTIWISIGKDDL